MASLIQLKPKGRSPFWYCCFRGPDGRRMKKSTELTARSKAMEVCKRWQRAADMARARTLTEERAREVISEIVASVHGGEGLRSFTTRQWFEHFAKIKKASQDPKTVAKYEQIKTEFLDFLGGKADLDVLSVNSADIRAFRDAGKDRLSATTLNDKLVILSAYFNGAWRDHVISNNPCTAVEEVRDDLSPKKRQKQPFTLPQVRALLAKATPDWQGVIKIAFFTGARLGDCARLRLSNLDLAADPPTITFENYSKHGDDHTVPMHPALVEHFRRRSGNSRRGKVIKFPGSDGFLFPSLATNADGKTPRRVANLSKQFRALMDAAGIVNHKVREAGKGAARIVWALGFHSLRRTHISTMANAGVSEEQRMAITAHATRDVHKGYTHHELERLHESVSNALPAL